MRDLFECDCDIYFAATGTAANGMALASLCQSYHSVVCHDYAHIETDECGAPEFFSNGTKLLLIGGDNGQIEPDRLREIVTKRSDIHYPRPRVLSITQATELGTVYSIDKVGTLCQTARSLGLRVHMDGARFVNACASLNCSPAELTWRAGVDVLCLGGTKCGMLGGEAVIFFDRSLSKEFPYRCKQAGQLLSKMRFAAAPWIGLLENQAWLKYACHSNEMAKQLHSMLVEVVGVPPMFPVQANSVFVELPNDMYSALVAQGWDLYTFIGVGGIRFMCSWDTEISDITQLEGDLREIVASRLFQHNLSSS